MTPPPLGLTVLVVEDEPLVRMSAAEALRDEGFTVYEAADATEALEVMEDHQEVGVVFTDIDMPGMSGLELADEIHRRRPTVRCLLTSGRARRLAAGDPFLPKPYSLGRLGDAIRRAA
ncbi:response regulator [Caulobacter segnis]